MQKPSLNSSWARSAVDIRTSALGVIFDMDGVLVDSSAAHFEAFKAMGLKVGSEFTWEFFQRIFGLHNDEIFPLWLGPLSRAEVLALAREKEALYRKLAPEFVRPIPGVLDLIDALAVAGFRLAVGSSGPRENVEMAQDILGRREVFATTVSGDDVKHGKPAPDIFLRAARELALEASQCLVIEDALAGIAAALAAQMRVVAIATSLPLAKLSDATFAVQEMRELSPDVIRKILIK